MTVEDVRGWCHGLVPMVRDEARRRATELGGDWRARQCRGCSAWHVRLRKGATK